MPTIKTSQDSIVVLFYYIFLSLLVFYYFSNTLFILYLFCYTCLFHYFSFYVIFFIRYCYFFSYKSLSGISRKQFYPFLPLFLIFHSVSDLLNFLLPLFLFDYFPNLSLFLYLFPIISFLLHHFFISLSLLVSLALFLLHLFLRFLFSCYLFLHFIKFPPSIMSVLFL